MDFRLCDNKAQISCAITAQLITAFVFATQIVQFLLHLYLDNQYSTFLLWVYRPVCVGPCWKSQRPACLRCGSYYITALILDTPCISIMKTCPCNVYPLEPHFYIAKLGYAGVYLLFLFLLQNIDFGYSLEPPRRGGSNVYPQSMF